MPNEVSLLRLVLIVPVVVTGPPVRPTPAETEVTVPVFVVYAVVSNVQVFAAVFFNKPLAPDNASMAFRSVAPLILANGTVPVDIVPNVVIFVLPVQLDKATFSTSPRPTSLAVNASPITTCPFESLPTFTAAAATAVVVGWLYVLKSAQVPAWVKHFPVFVVSKLNDVRATLLLLLLSVITSLSPVAIVTSVVYKAPLFLIFPCVWEGTVVVKLFQIYFSPVVTKDKVLPPELALSLE